MLEGERGEGTLAWADVEGSNPGFDVESAWRAVGPEDLLTLIYTSGTTGPPKGVQLVHRNLLAAVESIERMIQFPDGAKVISWLPSAHIAERAAHHYLPIVYAMTITCCDDPRQVVSYLPLVKPTWFFAVPRIWEKLKAGLEAMLAEPAAPSSASPPSARSRRRGRRSSSSRRASRCRRSWRPRSPRPTPRCSPACARCSASTSSRRSTSAPRRRRARCSCSSTRSASSSRSCGGCRRPAAPAAATRPGKVRIGTVGPPAPGVEIKLADDGEVLMRSAVVMTGYRNLPEKTAEALDADGWLHTGDIGEFDEEGYLRIVDRKKELIIYAAGKNMSPANIESTLKGASPLIGQVCAIGDGRPYNTALIVLDADFAPAWAAQQRPRGRVARGARRPTRAMRAAVQAGVDVANARLARVEQIKKFTSSRATGRRAGTS